MRLACTSSLLLVGSAIACGTPAPPIDEDGSSGEVVESTGPGPGDSSGGPAQDCTIPAADQLTQLRDTWTGTLTLDQTFEGVSGSMEVEVVLDFGAHAAPTSHIAGLGMLGEWRAYAPGGGGSLVAFWEAGGVGGAFAYNVFEADGPANGLDFASSQVCWSDASFDWEYEVEYHYADLIDYTLYAYTEPTAPLVTMLGQEHYDVDGDTLTVEASAEGSTPAGDPITLAVSGTLQRMP